MVINNYISPSPPPISSNPPSFLSYHSYSVFNHAKCFAPNVGQSWNALTTIWNVLTITPCSRSSKMWQSRGSLIAFNWPSGPAWAAFLFLLVWIKAMKGSSPAPHCFFHFTMSKWATKRHSAALRRVSPSSCCRRSTAVRRPSLRRGV